MRDRKNGFPVPKPPKLQKLRGGVFDSIPWRFSVDSPDTTRSYTCVWGRATFDAAFIAMNNTTAVRAHIMARKGHSTEVVAYGDTLAAHTLNTVKKRDYVLCFGQRCQKETYKKKEQRETWDSEVKVSVVIVAKHLGLLGQLWEVHEKIGIGLPQFLLALWNLPDIQDRAREQSWWDERPDTWEGEDG